LYTLVCFILRGQKRFLLFSEERVVAVPGIQCDLKLLQTFAQSNKATRFFNLVLKTQCPSLQKIFVKALSNIKGNKIDWDYVLDHEDLIYNVRRESRNIHQFRWFS